MSDVFLFTFFGLYYTTRFRLYFPRHSSRDPSKFRCNKIHFNVVCDKEFNNHELSLTFVKILPLRFSLGNLIGRLRLVSVEIEHKHSVWVV